MKKISLFTLALAAGFVGMAQNQDPNKAHRPLRTDMSVQPRFGIRAGVNLAKLEIDDDSQSEAFQTDNKTGFFGGLFVNLPLGSKFAIQPEVNFTTQGSKVSYNVNNTPPTPGTRRENNEWDFYYVNIPVMLQAKLTSGLFVEAGPQVGFQLNAEDKDGNDISEGLKKTEFSGALGLGYLSRIGLGLNARYVMGFSNIYDADQANDEGKYKNRGLNLGLVYHFGAAK